MSDSFPQFGSRAIVVDGILYFENGEAYDLSCPIENPEQSQYVKEYAKKIKELVDEHLNT